MADNTETEALARIVADGQQVRIEEIEGVPYVFSPHTTNVRPLPELLPTPTRSSGTYHVYDAESFVKLWQRYQLEARSAIYVKPPELKALTPPVFRAVFNDHLNEELAGWRDFCAKYACPFSPEWIVWMAMNGSKMAQVDMAEFIEDNQVDIRQVPGEKKDDPAIGPSASEMLTLAHGIQAKRDVRFKGVVNLKDGSGQLDYEEDVKGEVQGGKMAIPDAFYIAIPVFQNGGLYRLKARLRYRVREQRLVIWYDLHRPHKTLEQAYRELLDNVMKAVGDERVYVGEL